MERDMGKKFTIMVIVSMMLLISCLTLQTGATPEPSRASDGVPQWPTFKGSMDRSGRSEYNIGSNRGELLWKVWTSPVRNSSIAIGSDGTSYIGSRSLNVYAVTPQGRVKWGFLVDDEVHSSPTMDGNGNIYFGSLDSSFYSIDTDGVLNWRCDLDGPIVGSPAVTSERIFIGTLGGGLYCLDRAGRTIWNFSTEGSIHSSPALLGPGRLLFTSTDHFLYCLYTNGTLYWKYDMGAGSYSTPSVGEEGSIYVTADDRRLHCVNSLGDRVWTYTISDTGWASPSSYGSYQTVIGTSTGYVHLVGMHGREQWKYHTSIPITSSISVSNDGLIVFGTRDGNVYCLDDKGSVEWRYELENEVASTPSFDSEGNIYVADSTGYMYKIGSRPRERPSPPQNLDVEVEERLCRLDWDEPLRDGNSTLEGYSIIRWDETENLTEYLGATDPDVTYFVDIDIEYDHTYHYSVSAFNSVGDSDPSNIVAVTPEETPRPPGKPSGLSHSVEGFYVNIQWSPPADHGTSRITGYHIYRYDGLGQLEINEYVYIGTGFHDMVPEKDRYYYYSVAAVSDAGEGPHSDQERVFVMDEERTDWNVPGSSRDQESEGDTDITGAICCLLAFIGVVSFPIILIIIITRAIKGSEQKKRGKMILNDRTSGRKSYPRAGTVRIDTRPERYGPVHIPGGERPAGSVPAVKPVSKPPEAEGKVDVGRIPLGEGGEPGGMEETGQAVDLGEEEGMIHEREDEIAAPAFERPSPAPHLDQDEYIVERIMELQDMLADGEIDKDMYDTLKKRLVDQLDR
ncbi:MAG: PQQ-binding-like beta-propeller repeat protein [Thermoplasmatota archaeon]